MVQIETSDEKTAAGAAMKQTAADIAMHITATKPLSLDKSGISAETIEREKAIFAEQIKNKPANIIDKIVEGKMKKFFAENCLIEQQFVKDDSKTVAQVLDEAAKQSGGAAKIKRFVRFEIG
jgi:elongation factor Ts